MDHPSERLLGLYALNPALVHDLAVLEAHLDACAACCEQLADIRAVDAALCEKETWSAPPDEANDDVRAFARRAAEEDAAAIALLEPYESQDAAANFVWEDVSRKPGFRTGGIARRLCKLANGMCERQPLYALSLAEAATRIAMFLPDDSYPRGTIHELRGEAWKEQANAFRFLGRFADALKALDAAEEEYRQLPISGVGRIAVQYVRAYVLFEQDQFDAAEVLARESARAALHLGETDRFMRAQYLQAEILTERSETGAAAKLLAELLAYGERMNDRRWIARASLGAGVCDVARADPRAARDHLYRALRLYTELGYGSEVARTNWTIARMMFVEGATHEATHKLRTAIRDLASFGMLTDAAVAATDLAEVLHALGRTREIPKLLAGVVQTFTAAGKLTGALTALAYLKDAAAAGNIVPAAFPHVRRFLARAERQPGLLFAPPPAN